MSADAEQVASTEALFSSIGDGVITTDEFGRITRLNPMARHILGYKSDELIGEWFPKKIVALDWQENTIPLIDRPITKAFLTGKPINEKMYYLRKNGQKVPVAITAAPIILDDKPLGAVEVFRDITLEQEIDRMKSEFISLASHQLRTPLSAIKTYTHMLADGFMGELNADQKQSLSTIISASNRMNELISTLLNITRMESGTIAITPKYLKLDAAIKDLIPELKLMSADKDIKLNFRMRGSYSNTIKTDSLIIKEVVTNLASNAIKYTPKGGSVDINLKLRRSDVVIEVKDSGWGIPKYSQDQIFSKFFRASNIVKQETTGTGLGLYLVKGLVEALGGEVWFKSEEGQGTMFSVSLPRARRKTKKAQPLTESL